MSTVIMLCSCKKEEVTASGGSFSFQGNRYPLYNLRIEHIGYEEENFILALSAYPSTYKKTESASSGNGAVLSLYFSIQEERFSDGDYELLAQWSDSLFSNLTIYPVENTDTAVYNIKSGTLKKEAEKYTFSLATEDDENITGEYHGNETYNFSVDKQAYGTLSFDTINCSLSRPVVYDWGNIFSSETSYRELVFYSTDSRFTDQGKFRNGVQLVLGFNLDNQKNMPAGVYPVSNDYNMPDRLLYGHKVSNTAWGCYWQVFRNGSTAGKANILSESLTIDRFDDNGISFSFVFTDQLDNTVTGEYDGIYYMYK